MKPIRKLAGFTKANGMYHNTRTTIVPSMELQYSTPIDAWAINARNLFLSSGVANDKPTAMNFLQFICEMNIVFLQDAAAMAVLHPERKSNPLYGLPCLQSKAFQVSTTAAAVIVFF